MNHSVLPEKKLLRNKCKRGVFGGNYPLIFNLSGQSYAFKSRLYMPQFCEFNSMNLKQYKFW